jgi:hypothetical protein
MRNDMEFSRCKCKQSMGEKSLKSFPPKRKGRATGVDQLRWPNTYFSATGFADCERAVSKAMEQALIHAER